MKKKLFLLYVLASVSLKLNAMEKASMPTYTVGIKIPNDTYAYMMINPIYMTIAYIGHMNKEKYREIATTLNTLNKLRPIELEVKEAGFLGAEQYQFYARKLAIKNKKILKYMLKLYYEYGECELGMPDNYVMPNWHMPFKSYSLHGEFLLKENTTIAGGALFIKQVGKDASVFELN